LFDETEPLYDVLAVTSILMLQEKSRFVAKVAAFTALTAVLDALIIPQLSSGVWFGLVYLVVPVTGILLGPWTGFASTLIGVMASSLWIFYGVVNDLFSRPCCPSAAFLGYVGCLSCVYALATCDWITISETYLVGKELDAI
jgi:hypothetical protein